MQLSTSLELDTSTDTMHVEVFEFGSAPSEADKLRLRRSLRCCFSGSTSGANTLRYTMSVSINLMNHQRRRRRTH